MRKVIALCLILLASTCYAATVTIEVEDDMEIVIKKKAVKSIPMNTFQAYSSYSPHWNGEREYIRLLDVNQPHTTLEYYGGWN